MDIAQTPEPLQELVITLELIAEGDGDDSALINTVRYETLAALQREGYKTFPAAYSEEKGAGLLVEFVTTVQQIAATVWNDHAVITEGIADISGLVTIFAGISSVLKRVRQAHEKCVGKEESTARPMKVAVEIDGKLLALEVSDIAQADAALRLAMKYRSEYPDSSTQVTTKRKVKIQGRVPTRKKRPRR